MSYAYLNCWGCQHQVLIIIDMYNKMEECVFCSLKWNNGNRKPKVLKCKHVFCLECVQTMYARDMCVKCWCMEEDNRDPSLMLDEMQIIASISTLKCIHCQDKGADFIDISDLETFCNDCSRHTTKAREELRQPIIDTIKGQWYDSLAYKLKDLPSVLKKLYWQTRSSGYQSKTEVGWKIQSFRSDSIMCENHHFTNAMCIGDGKYLIPLCEVCAESFDGKLYSLDHEGTFAWIWSVLQEKLQISDLTAIPSYFFKFFKRGDWTQKAILFLIKFLSGVEKEKISIKNKCPLCFTHFSFGKDIPVRLSCPNCIHAVCFNCWRNTEGKLSCPFDGIIQSGGEPEVIIPDGMYSHPICECCSRKFSLEKLRPFKALCGHLLCENCNVCRICNMLYNGGGKKECKTTLKKLEFMELKCSDHKRSAIKFGKEGEKLFYLPIVYCDQCPKSGIVLSQTFNTFDQYVNECIKSFTNAVNGRETMLRDSWFQIRNSLNCMGYDEKLRVLNSYVTSLLDEISKQTQRNPNEDIKEIKRFEKNYPNSGNFTKAWRVSPNQVESITLIAQGNLQLHGIILGGLIDGSAVTVDLYINYSETTSNDNSRHIPETIDGQEDTVNIDPPHLLVANSPYTIVVQYSKGPLYNGNPSFRIVPLIYGAIGITVIQPTYDRNHVKHGRNDLGGPILGFKMST